MYNAILFDSAILFHARLYSMLNPSLQHRQLLPTGLLGTNPFTLSIPSVSPIISLPLLPTPTSTTSPTLSSSSFPFSSVSSTSTSSTVSTSTSSTPTTTSTTAVSSTTSSAVHVTTSGGRTITVVVDPTSSPSPAVMANSFLGNKTAQGIVFALVGIVVLILIIVFATFALRRRSRRRLTDEAISFDPGAINAERRSMEKASIRSSGSDRDHRPHYLNAPQYPRS
ncbi:hypothetical protein APHAL10511_002017 [Amanita phalloides]|nr:hypothetical protein APHAL10511_002017 [Amanita phalloides]